MNILNKIFGEKEKAEPNYTFLVSGMHCSSCATNIEVAIEEIEGVSEATVSQVTNRLKIWGKGKDIESKIVKTVEELGYKAVKI